MADVTAVEAATVKGAQPRPSDFLATNRGGGLYSEAVSQRLGSLIAFAAQRLGVTPTVLTLANLFLGLAASTVVIALASGSAAGSVPAAVPGLVALLGWQLAYAFDCADGQLARVTGRTSAAGARLDILCDVAAQTGIVAALGATAAAYRSVPAWLIAVFAGTWMVNLVTSVMQSGAHGGTMLPSRSLAVRLIKLIRDYGAVVLASSLVVLFVPEWTVVVIVAFTAVNGLFLLASIAHTATR